MPSLKMKNKLSMSYFKEKNGLHVSQMSSKISKNSCPQFRISEQASEFDTFIHKCQDVSLSTQASMKNIESDESIDSEELLDEEIHQLQQQPTFFVCSASIGRTESTHSSDLGTIFSPTLEQSHTEQKADDDAGNIKDPDMPGLGADDSDDNRSSSDYQTCDSLLFDVSEQYMTLPFLEDTVKTSDMNDAQSHEEAMMVSDYSSSYVAIGQRRSCNSEIDVNTDSDPQMFIKNLPELSDVASNFQPTILPKDTQNRKPVTLVLDLDETLVHSTLEHRDDADFTFTVFFDMKEHTVYVKQRPYLHTFLERVAEMFEVVIFTASQSIYAEQLLDIVDQDGKLISRRVFRESCIFSDGGYTKDLTVLGVDLAKVAIVDNSPQVFRLQVNNGIPIRSWFDDPSDCALISLLPFLETLVDADDVRPIIAARFSNKE
ncbi:hypothetical protein CIPAW_10G095900 [Carya illinoinensis]|uniref:FCP1 homology domain-containing protein n=1 Tax=Carya illinoinensis TaxID=32201 RepID=A0A8T1P650_CARIL|nr:hypothetical protein CIPAW_10G095900 [Carya illinoinensis]